MELELLDGSILYKNILVGKYNKLMGRYFIQGFDENFPNLNDLKEHFLKKIFPEIIKDEFADILSSSPSSIIIKTNLSDYYINVLSNLKQNDLNIIDNINMLDIEILTSNGLLTDYENNYKLTEKGTILVEKLKT